MGKAMLDSSLEARKQLIWNLLFAIVIALKARRY
jgi:hypothetical protein